MISQSVQDFLTTDARKQAERLAYEDIQHHRINESQQLRAWERSVEVLQQALTGWSEATSWRVILEFSILRLGKRIDAVLLTPRSIIVIEFKIYSTIFNKEDCYQVEDYALDLQDFHAGSQDHPIFPVLVATAAHPKPTTWPLPFDRGVASTVLEASSASLGNLLRELAAHAPTPRKALDVLEWERAPYAPVPSIIDAARTLYEHHDVAEITSAGAGRRNLTETTAAIFAAIEAARNQASKTVVFVTGVPGAGKTLCGLNAVFGVNGRDDATYLTGNPTLVHVLRQALVRDAKEHGMAKRAAEQKMEKAIQALPRFRDSYLSSGDVPAERVIVVDEAQRTWSADYAIQKSRSRAVQLSDSEAGHLLDIMARHQGWAVIVCLIGGGQEIHNGEGGVAGWGRALEARPEWQVRAAPNQTTNIDPRQKLPPLPSLRCIPALYLDVPVRNVRNPDVAEWVDAVLRADLATARTIASRHGTLPFTLTRDLPTMRGCLRQAARGKRRAGLVASSGAKRLRADGLGCELPHMEPERVARWFLDYWPDVRASGALDVVATEFSVQGLELDFVGLCWGGDLLPSPDRKAWRVRNFVGTTWQALRGHERMANRFNTYRVLLTRARDLTVIWVPRGDAEDQTRSPKEFDAVADMLMACGVPILKDVEQPLDGALAPLL